MWSGMSGDADADYGSSIGAHSHDNQLASESASSSDSESTAEDRGLRSSPAPSTSPLASPTSSSPSPPRQHPVHTGTISDLLAWQLHQPVVHSLKTWIQGDDFAASQRQHPEGEHQHQRMDAEGPWGPGLWSWCLGVDDSFWGLDGHFEGEDATPGMERQLQPQCQRQRQREDLADERRWFLCRGAQRREQAGLRHRRSTGGQARVTGEGPPSQQKGMAQPQHVSEELLLMEHHKRLGQGAEVAGGVQRCNLDDGVQEGAGVQAHEQDGLKEGSRPAPAWEARASGSLNSSSQEPEAQIPLARDQRKKLRLHLDLAEDTDANQGPGARTLAPQHLQEATEKAQVVPNQGSLKQQAPTSWQGKLASFAVRSFSTLWMVAGFALLAYMGHMFMWALVLILQAMMVQELFALGRRLKPEGSSVFPQLLDWHFVLTAMVYMYGQLLKDRLVATAGWEAVRSLPLLHEAILRFVRNHFIISYGLYLAGFVRFVLLLQEGNYMTQLADLARNHMIVFLIVLQSSFFAPNIFQGLVWFLLPCSLVIANDCSAYMFGFFLGRTPLIRVSPKKTWEGFLGGAVMTTATAFVLAGLLGKYDWLTCPRRDFSLASLRCTPDPMFLSQSYAVPAVVQPFLPTWAHIWWISAFQRHALALGVFASTVAPFGGFFASGVKRALGVKDFGSLIPGHGGVTDRMDCQMLMALFSYIYFQTFVSNGGSVDAVMTQLLSLNPAELQAVQATITAAL